MKKRLMLFLLCFCLLAAVLALYEIIYNLILINNAFIITPAVPATFIVQYFIMFFTSVCGLITSVILCVQIIITNDFFNSITPYLELRKKKREEREAEEREKKKQRIQAQIEALQEQLNNEETE